MRNNRERRTLCILLVTGLLCLSVSGCDSVRDWWNRDNPVPKTPIAPFAKPAPKEYTWQQAKVEMVNALIFALSMRSDSAMPQIQYDTRDTVLRDICSELARNHVIANQFSGTENVYILVSRETPSGEWNVVLQTCGTNEILLNKTLKIKD